ncbi:MAG: GNAT family N-acetyltransferase, partial [Spirochaetia bacterium]|nr:GNAT family N-acetyltransferase [Spirochaetia bacterium]
YKPTLSCIQAVYTSKEPLGVDPSLKIRPIVAADLELIVRHYTHTEPSYVRDRVCSRTMLGVEIDGELAAFMGRHSEGAMGLLEVLPQYRRRHLGQELESAYINLMLKQGLVPYCNVETNNTASLALQKKLGLVFAKQHIYWFS